MHTQDFSYLSDGQQSKGIPIALNSKESP